MNMECKVRGRGLFAAFVVLAVVYSRQAVLCRLPAPRVFTDTSILYHIPPVPPNVLQCNLTKGQHAYVATPNDGIVSDGPWSYGG